MAPSDVIAGCVITNIKINFASDDSVRNFSSFHIRVSIFRYLAIVPFTFCVVP